MSFYQPVAPAGSNGQVQFNDNGGFGGDVDLTYDKTTNALSIGGDINLNDGGTYTTTVQVVTPTAARTISFPDATGTVGLVAGSSGNLVANQSGAYAGVANSSVDSATGNITLGSRFISTLNGALSATGIAGVPLAVTGTWIAAGGTATTTKPQVLIEPTGATSTAWSTAGTGLGVNAASGFTGRLLDLQLNGTSNFNVDSTGRVSFPLATAALPALYPGTDTNTGMWSPAADTLAWSTNGVERTRIDSSGRLLVGTSSAFGANYLQIQGDQTIGSAGIGAISLRRGAALGVMGASSTLGRLEFGFVDGGVGAQIAAVCDAASAGTDDYPGRLVFSTTADGAASPTERLRITSTGLVTFAGATSSFPALKRDGTVLETRLADDTGFATTSAQLRAQGTAPASAAATGTAGDIRYDADYIYVCTATNTWKRAALSTW